MKVSLLFCALTFLMFNAEAEAMRSLNEIVTFRIPHSVMSLLSYFILEVFVSKVNHNKKSTIKIQTMLQFCS